MISNNGEIRIDLDKVTHHYNIAWQLSIIGLGKTKQEALEDLREAAHFGVDSFINEKLRNIEEIVVVRPGFIKQRKGVLDVRE